MPSRQLGTTFAFPSMTYILSVGSKPPHLAVCVLSAWGADLLPGELPAAPEGVAGGAARTAADGHVILHCAL